MEVKTPSEMTEEQNLLLKLVDEFSKKIDKVTAPSQTPNSATGVLAVIFRVDDVGHGAFIEIEGTMANVPDFMVKAVLEVALDKYQGPQSDGTAH